MNDLTALLFLLEHQGILGQDPQWRRISDMAYNAFSGKRDHYTGDWHPSSHQRPPAYTPEARGARRAADVVGRRFGGVTVVRATDQRSATNRAVLWLCSDGKLRQLTDLRKMGKRAA